MLRLRRAEWSPKTSLWLGRITWLTKYHCKNLFIDIKTKKQFLYNAWLNDLCIGCCVVRFEKYIDHNEMCVTALGGEFGSLRFMMKYGELLNDLARQNHCQVIRGHVDRKGLKYMYEKFGFTVREFFNNEWVMVRDV